jgi:hypothetical protein
MIASGFGIALPALSGPAVYWPAYFEHIPTKPPELLIFPPTGAGSAVRVPLPTDLPKDFRLIEYSADGKLIYGQKLNSWDGITKIEFGPLRQSLIPGSNGFGTVSSIVTLEPSGRILLSGLFRSQGPIGCGIFELDPDARRVRRLFEGKFPHCGGAISPDGKHSVQFPGNHLSIVDLDTGAVHDVGDGLSGATWSPDGRWIAVVSGKLGASSVVLIDAHETGRRRNLGPSRDGQAQWSPDSRSLLVATPRPSQCGPDLWSLEIIDIETGTRREVRSAHCKIFQNSTGWLDHESVSIGH